MEAKIQRRWTTGLVCLLLVAGTMGVFWQTRHFDFTNYDDEHYVTQNPLVLGGLTPQGIWKALTTGYFSYWHPLTWMSHMLDVELFGLQAGGHHLMSVALHLLSSIVLFLVLRRYFGGWIQSAIVAALFTWHPTHVESVAWIAERKDVLSGLFWILTIGAYGWYAERPNALRYLLAIFFCGCGIMSKPMVVTLPFVLALLDYWPLTRLERLRPSYPPGGAGAATFPCVTFKQALLEKVPFFFMALVSCAVTMYGVRHAGSIVSDQQFPLGLRLANVPISYARYLGKLFWPDGMAVLYPMPPHWELWKVAASSLVVAGLTVPIVALWRRRPYLVIGWLWYLGTLVPTIGLVPVGLQSIADRYTYIPFIGLFVMLVWGIGELTEKWPFRKPLTATSTLVAFLGCLGGAWRQTSVWRNNETLFAHALAVTKDNAIAHYNLGLSLALRGEFQVAAEHFTAAARIDPKYDRAHNNLGVILTQLGKPAEATNHFARVLALKPNDNLARLNWGKALFQLGDLEGSLAHLSEALLSNPRHPEIHFYLGRIWLRQNKPGQAIRFFEEAARLQPNGAEVQAYLAWAYNRSEQFAAGATAARKALELSEAQNLKNLTAFCRELLKHCEAQALFEHGDAF